VLVGRPAATREDGRGRPGQDEARDLQAGLAAVLVLGETPTTVTSVEINAMIA
jgi:hypothetical protein